MKTQVKIDFKVKHVHFCRTINSVISVLLLPQQLSCISLLIHKSGFVIIIYMWWIPGLGHRDRLFSRTQTQAQFLSLLAHWHW
jgi:hypothetical protein